MVGESPCVWYIESLYIPSRTQNTNKYKKFTILTCTRLVIHLTMTYLPKSYPHCGIVGIWYSALLLLNQQSPTTMTI